MTPADLSYVHIAVLKAIGSRELTINEIRQELGLVGISKSTPSVFLIMNKLCTGLFVKKRKIDLMLDGGKESHEMRYTMLPNGVAALNNADEYVLLN